MQLASWHTRLRDPVWDDSDSGLMRLQVPVWDEKILMVWLQLDVNICKMAMAFSGCLICNLVPMPSFVVLPILVLEETFFHHSLWFLSILQCKSNGFFSFGKHLKQEYEAGLTS